MLSRPRDAWCFRHAGIMLEDDLRLKSQVWPMTFSNESVPPCCRGLFGGSKRVCRDVAGGRTGEITVEGLYPCDARWSGLYDPMFPHTSEEIERRLALAADYRETV